MPLEDVKSIEKVMMLLLEVGSSNLCVDKRQTITMFED